MKVIACGFDTLRPVFKSSEPLPVFDEDWQDEMISRGFEAYTGRQLNRRTNQVDAWSSWKYQDPHNSSLRVFVRGARYLEAEFSAPCLESGSPLNLDLVAVQGVYELVARVRDMLTDLVPAVGTLVLLKFRRADYAVDIQTGTAMRDVIDSFEHMRLKGSRKDERFSYCHQGILIKGSKQSFSVYPKGIKMEASLNRKERKRYAPLIQEAKDVGRLRLEYRYNPRGGISAGYLEVAAETLAAKIADGFPGGCSKTVSCVRGLIEEVDALPISYSQKTAIIADILRRDTFGLEYIRQQAKGRTAERKLSHLRKLNIRFDESASKVIKIDFSPVISVLKAA